MIFLELERGRTINCFFKGFLSVLRRLCEFAKGAIIENIPAVSPIHINRSF